MGISLAFLGVVVAPESLQGQVMRGRAIDAQLGRPIPRVLVEIALGGKVVARGVTADDGSFGIDVRRPNQYVVRASALGYLPVESTALTVSDDEIVEITLRLSGSPIPIEGITIETRRQDQRRAATYEGLYARRERALKVGTERVVVLGDPELEGAGRVSDVLGWFRPPRGCIDYYVNGRPRDVVVSPKTDLRRVREEETWISDLPAAFLEGVEYYRNGFFAPQGYFGGLCAMLGVEYSVIAIWYRRPGT